MHLHAAKDLLEKYDNKQWDEVVPAEFPTLLDFKQTKEYVRDILDTQVELTVDREDFVDIAELPKKHEFFQYQDAVHGGDVESATSHTVIVAYQDQDEDGEDYRYEESDNPVAALADRTEDNTDIGRVANARAEYDAEEEDDDDIEADVVDEEVMEDDDDDEDEDDEEERSCPKKKQGRKKMAKARSR